MITSMANRAHKTLPNTRVFLIGWFFMLFGAVLDANGGYVLQMVPTTSGLILASLILCFSGFAFVMALNYGMGVRSGYAKWNLSTAITNAAVGVWFLHQYPKYPILAVVSAVIGIWAVYLASPSNELDESVEKMDAGIDHFVYIMLIAGLLLAVCAAMFAQTVNFDGYLSWIPVVLWVIALAFSEILGTPWSISLDKKFKSWGWVHVSLARKFLSFSIAYLPAVVLYLTLIQANSGLLYVSNIFGNTGTAVMAILVMPKLYKVGSYSKRSIFGIILALLSAFLVRSAF